MNKRPILLVEDNPLDLDLTLRAFKRQKFLDPIEIARDGEEAMALIDRWDKGYTIPLVILLDLKMPKLNGLEYLQILKQNVRYKNIPVVVLTTSADTGDYKKAYELGANSYVLKPVVYEKFVEVMGMIITYWTSINKTV